MQNYAPVVDALRDQFAPGTATIPLATLEQATQLITGRSADLAGNNQSLCPHRQGSQHHPNPAIAINSSIATIITSPAVIDIFGTLSPTTVNLIADTVSDVIAYLFPGGNSSTIGLLQDGLDYFIQNFSVDDLVSYLPEVLALFGSGSTPAPITPAPITPAPITPAPALSEAEELALLLNELQVLVDNNPTLGTTPSPITPPPIATPPIATPPIATPPTPTPTPTTDSAELEALLAELQQLVNANSGL